MGLVSLGSIGDFAGGLGAIVSVLYLVLPFGFDKMLRPHEEGLVDPEV